MTITHPPNWVPHSIGELALKTKQRNPSLEPNDYIEYVDVSSVSNSLYKIVEHCKLIGKDAPSRARKVIEHNDILFATVRPTLKRIAIVPANLNNQICSTGFCVLKPNPANTHYGFLYYYLLTDFVTNKMESIQRGASYPAIRDSDLKKLIVPLPPLPEQRKIAAILSTVQKAIENQQSLIDRITELKKVMMQKLFTEGTKGEKQKMTGIGLVPESWEVVALGKHARIKNGCAFKSSDYVSNGVLSVRIGNVSHGELINKDNKYLPRNYLTQYSEFALNEGDLVISLTRPIISTGMKYCFVEKKHLPLLLNQRVGKFEVKDREKISNDYLFYIVFSKYFTEELKRLFGNSSQQPNVSTTQLEKFLIPLPTKDEQIAIAKALNSIAGKEKMHISKKLKLEELFRTLLHQLMAANIVVDNVPIPYLEPEI